MKKIIVLLSLITLNSCAQNQKTMDKIRNLYKDIKNKENSINYNAQIYIGGCNYEVLINDMPVDNYFGPANGAMSGSTPINTSILKSGLQTWKIKIYPVYQNGIFEKEISKGARVETSIEGIKFKDNGNIERLGKMLDFEAETVKDSETTRRIFADAGKPYVEYSGTFRADVPYELIGWSKSQDLTKLDSTKLEQEIIKVYKEASTIIDNKEIQKFEDNVLNKEKEIAQALFCGKSESQELASFYEESFTIESLKMVPLENYKVVYYGNGRVVGLERIDYIGSSALASFFEDEDGKEMMFKYNYLLHKPEGSDKLEVIR